MKASLFCFLALVVAAIGYSATNPSPATPRFTAKEIAQGYREHVILAHPRPERRASVDDAEARENVHVRQKFDRLGDLRVIELDTADDAAAAINRLRATGRYDFVEPDYLRYVQVTPNDPKVADGSMWQLNNTGQSGNVIGVVGADIKAYAAWDILHDAPNVVVAVVDTGINLSHQDITANLWTNPTPSSKNDLHGANFVGGNGSMVSGDPTDDEGHGTHVAGTIGAVGNNGVASVGIAWSVKLMAVKVLSAQGSGTVSDIVGGINYAISHGANIINASFGADTGTGYSQSELTAINSARSNGVIFVAAAGNSTANLDVSRTYPASFAVDNVVTVGSSNRRDEVSTFSNYGAAIDLFAPGEEIVSLNYASNTGTISFSGTSMATPHVTGAFALLKAKFPNDSYRQLINRLLRSVDHGALFAGKAQTGGRLNLLRALQTGPGENAPFNDNFADRPHYNTDNLSIRSNNAGATAESGEPSITGNAPGASLWWEWTAPASGTVSVDTMGSAYDTVLAVYTGTALNALTPVASNDNGGSGVTSRLTFAAQAGTTYEISVDGKNGATGLTLLNLGTTPANDAFATPVTLTGDSTHISATNLHCSREAGEPTILGFSGGNSLWYKWTAPRSTRYQVSATSADFDPILAVYTGTALTSLSLVSASDNTGADNSQTASLCTIDATAGTTYLITVDSKTASTVGQFTLSLVDSQWQATTGGSVTGAPAVASDGTVYVGSSDHSLYAFGADGSQKWTYATGSLIDTCSPAVADDGSVYVGSADGKLYAFTAAGALKWSHAFSTGTSAVGAGCSPAIAADGTIYTRVTDGYLYALNPTDGSVKWKYNINALGTGFYGNPIVAPDGTIYQASDETDAKLYAVNPDGTKKWILPLDSGVYGAPALDAAGNVYLVTLTGGAYSITPAGVPRWHLTSGGNVSSSVALSADGATMYYAAYDKNIYARRTSDGSVVWTYPMGAEARASSPAIDSNGVIYIGSYDYKLYAVNPDGSLNRTYDTGNWIRSAPAIAGSRLYVGSNDQKLYAFALSAGVAGGPWAQYRANARRLGRAVSDALGITTQPQSQTAVIGLPLTLSVGVTGQGPLTYQWSKDGAVLAGATGSTYTVASAAPANAGSYTVAVTGPQGTVTSSPATVTIQASNPGRLVNLSVRTTAGTGAQTLIVGFAVSGTAPKPLLIRGIGPALAQFGITDALSAPQLAVIPFGQTQAIASATGWDSSLSTTFASVGAFGLPTGSKDDAVSITLNTATTGASYTAQITGVNGATGTALAEIYDLDPLTPTTTPSRLINVSARSQVGTGGNVLIAGFAISGNVPKQVLIRGIGPALAQPPFSIGGTLADPRLDVYDSNNVLVGSNDNWGGATTLSTAFQTVSAFGLSTTSRDAALLITLPPGRYSAQVSGVGGTTGVGMVEVYEMP